MKKSFLFCAVAMAALLTACNTAKPADVIVEAPLPTVEDVTYKFGTYFTQDGEGAVEYDNLQNTVKDGKVYIDYSTQENFCFVAICGVAFSHFENTKATLGNEVLTEKTYMCGGSKYYVYLTKAPTQNVSLTYTFTVVEDK